jgi:uncharacterized protein YpiB (UPF0302 family)
MGKRVSEVIPVDKFYSYTDFLKGLGQCTEETEHERFLNEIYLDLFLNRLGRLHRIEQLYQMIDEVLDAKDEQLFMQYSQELIELQSCE